MARIIGPWREAQRSAPPALGLTIGRWAAAGALTLGLLFLLPAVAAYADGPGGGAPEYRSLPFISSRVALWIAAEVHLMFAAFVLGVPIFAVVVEVVGWRTGDIKYDNLAKEFTKLLVMAFSTTAAFGGVFLFLLTTLYPKLFSYLADIFAPTMVLYALLFFGEGFTLYLYWYGWDRMRRRKGLHIALGVLLNLFGTVLMFLANAWLTFSISPAGLDEGGNLMSLWAAINNPTWTPVNVHRIIANVAFGGAIVGMYAAFRFLGSTKDEDRAHYDWMGYVGNFIAVMALIPLPFAGYWLGREIYGFNQQMGITMMGGFLSWLWIIQALLIGVLFLTSNYYLWIGLGRIQGGERYKKYVKYLLIVLTVSFLVWATPHSLVASLEEARRIGAAHHPLLGVLGVMSAKNTAVNLMILTTFISFLFYRRANKVATVSWKTVGQVLQGGVVALAAAVVIFLGVYGYFVPAIVRIGFSVYQVLAVLSALVLGTLIDLFLFRGARSVGAINWGQMPRRSQYALMALAITFTWLMGLMGYARNAIRQHWHVFGVLRDTSPDAFSPTLGYAAAMISVCVVVFLGLIAFIFWLGGLEEKPELEEVAAEAPAPAPIPALAPARASTSVVVAPIFFLMVIGSYTYFANSIPQIESRPPQEVEVAGVTSPEALAQVGEQIVGGKGTCLVCHGLGSAGPRAPDLQGVGARAATRKGGFSPEEYLRESLLEPCNFVVEGYPCIMPPAHKPPVGLSDGEVIAVIAFLQSLGGQITVQPPAGGLAQEVAPAAASGEGAGLVKAVVQKGGCGACHVIPGLEGTVGVLGPNLAGLGSRKGQEYIRQSILDPDAVVAEGFPPGVMPKDFGQKLTPQELDALVAYLATLKGG